MSLTNNITYYILLPFLFVLILTPNSNAQVATPSMDTSIPVKLAAATAWRDRSVIGAVGTQGTSEGTEKTPTNDGTSKSSGKSASYLGSGKITSFVSTEVFQTIEEREQEWESSSRTSGDNTKYKSNKMEENTQANFAFDFGTYSLGFTYNTSKSIEETRENRNDATEDTVTETRTDSVSYGLSYTVRLANIFYLGVGAIQTYDKPYSRVNNSWTDQMAGIALHNDLDSRIRFRIEVSRIESPESLKDGKNDDPEIDDSNRHFASTEDINSLEIGLNNIRTVLRIENNVKESTHEDQSKKIFTRITQNTIGGIYTFGNGLHLGLYQVIGSEKSESEFYFGSNTYMFEQESKSKYYRLSIAINY
jgi:hypothetical protein